MCQYLAMLPDILIVCRESGGAVFGLSQAAAVASRHEALINVA